MVDGTVYEIDHGVANVDGTAYEVGFVTGIPVTIGAKVSIYDGYGSKGSCWVDNVLQQNNTTIMVEPSSVLEVDVGVDGYGLAGSTTARVYLNGVSVFSQTFSKTGESVRYQINLEGVSSVNISWTARLANSNSDADVYDCYITVVPDDSHALVTITGTGWSSGAAYSYVEIDGTRYGDTYNSTTSAIAVPIGTTIYCTALDEHERGSGRVTFNYRDGTSTYESNPTDYPYTLTGNVTIELDYYKDSYGVYGKITITET